MTWDPKAGGKESGLENKKHVFTMKSIRGSCECSLQLPSASRNLHLLQIRAQRTLMVAAAWGISHNTYLPNIAIYKYLYFLNKL